MVAVVGVRVIVDPAGAVIHEMGGYDQQHGGNQHPSMEPDHELLGYQEPESGHKYRKREQGMVMFLVSMVK